MSLRILILSSLLTASILPACSADERDGDVSSTDTVRTHDSDADEGDSTTAGDVTIGDMADADDAPQECAPNAEPPCPSGQLCVHVYPPYCTGADYGGFCEPTPTTCPQPTASDAVTGCDGTVYASVCEARSTGYDELLFRAEGQPCGTSSTTHCEGTALCIQTAPGVCSDDYEGVCEARPESCPEPQPGDAVVTCYGMVFDSECEARLGGYGQPLEPASTP